MKSESNTLFRNSVWYSFGAASSMVVGVGIESFQSPTVGRFALDVFGVAIIWAISFAFAWFGYLSSRFIVGFFIKFSGKSQSHFLPLTLGFTYMPIVLLMKDLMPDNDIAGLLQLIIPTIIAVLLMGILFSKQWKPETGDADKSVNPYENR